MKVFKHGKGKPGAMLPAQSELTPMRRIRNEIDRLIEEPFGAWWSNGPLFEEWMPVVDVFENKDNVVVKAELPGLQKGEIEVYMSGDNLNLAGERKQESEEKSGHTYRMERYFGRFHRSIPLPMPVDPAKIEARYKDGVLLVTCPKSEEAKRRQIEIKLD